MTTQTETVVWHLSSAELPDAGLSVLMSIPAYGDVYSGYWDDEEQSWVHDIGLKVKEAVTHWAEMPKGPSDEQRQ